VPHPRLIERLNAGLHRKLTLVSAPAGFGKTTLVSEWIASLPRGEPRSGALDGTTPPMAMAWLSLDESDNDLTRFLTYLISALQAAAQTPQADIAKGIWGALHPSPPPPAEGMLTALINEVAALPNQIVLILLVL
jgi:LuxR family maltose regulon positive regulatory protein